MMRKREFASPEAIRKALIGDEILVSGPFGECPMVYADSTASGRSIAFIEDYIRQAVLPMYANTHTEASATGLQTTRLREAARNRIHHAVGTNPKDYAVIFTGTGVTSAIAKFAQLFGISPLATKKAEPDLRPVVFISFYEHHSNELFWRESNVDVVKIPEDEATGSIDLEVLKNKLHQNESRTLRIASFSAASNVTGIRADVEAITKLVQSYGCISAWDFAAAGPHVDIALHKADAIFVSTHKFPGGPGTPGLLIGKRSTVFKTETPTIPGGGTVSFVKRNSQYYLTRAEDREEGGTPGIVESIRAGLVLDLHQKVGGKQIESIERKFLHEARQVWSANPNIVVLGNPNADRRLPIVSFLVKAPSETKYLHYNFVTALLNDVFGIQSRGGCACASPYGLDLLAIDDELADTLGHRVHQEGNIAVKPGWTRIAFCYYMSETTVNYIIKAVDLIATHGHNLLRQYKVNTASGQWHHINHAGRNGSMLLWDFEGNYEIPLTIQSSKSDYLRARLEEGSRILTSGPPRTLFAQQIWFALGAKETFEDDETSPSPAETEDDGSSKSSSSRFEF